jgi:hypothetical protein
MIGAANDPARGPAPTGAPAPWVWSDVDPAAHFAADYAEARAKFREAAESLALRVETHEHPLARGPQDETLAIDIALLGDSASRALVLVTSGTHGAEGFCGSGCQVAMLNDAAFLDAVQGSGVALAFVHALNPFGFAHVARTTEENVDLNRNFRDFAATPVNAAYLEVHEFMVPATWPPSAENEARLADYVARRGAGALQQAVSAGQSDRADGLFYAGTRPAWSSGVLREVLRRHAASRRRLAWIDIHTGLGPLGHGEKIFAGPDDASILARTRECFGADVTSIYDGSSTSARVAGMLFNAVAEVCPSVEYAGIALEYGTLPFRQVTDALRARQWLANHPGASAELSGQILRMTRDAFYVDTPAWKAMVFAQARTATLQALAGMKGAVR